jgi:hypothetical protein
LFFFPNNQHLNNFVRTRRSRRFASNRVVSRVDRVVLRQIASLDRVVNRVKSRRWIASLHRAANRVIGSRRWIAPQIASLDRAVGSRRQSRRTRRCRSASFCPIGTIFTILELAA